MSNFVYFEEADKYEKEVEMNELLKEYKREIDNYECVVRNIKEIIMSHYIVGNIIQNNTLDSIINEIDEILEEYYG